MQANSRRRPCRSQYGIYCLLCPPPPASTPRWTMTPPRCSRLCHSMACTTVHNYGCGLLVLDVGFHWELIAHGYKCIAMRAYNLEQLAMRWVVQLRTGASKSQRHSCHRHCRPHHDRDPPPMREHIAGLTSSRPRNSRFNRRGEQGRFSVAKV